MSSANKQLILVGGGHSHALVLRQWAKQPQVNADVTLISPQPMTPYSGMLPGLIAGHYSVEQAHIHLPSLCQQAGVTFIQAEVTAIDSKQQCLTTQSGEHVHYDLLSINTGITPNSHIRGAVEHAIAVKPIATLFERWQSLEQQLLTRTTDQPFRLGVVGGGAAGIELILAMHYRLHQLPIGKRPLKLVLIQAGTGLPEGYPPSIQKRIAQYFRHKHIDVLEHSRVNQVTPTGVMTDGTQEIPLDYIFWCTQAGAPAWPTASGLETDSEGFIQVNHALQVGQHHNIFACGDIARQQGRRTPRAGVFAVRQAPILWHNLRASLSNQPLKPYTPQSTYLSLLAAGDRYAWGCRLGPSWLGNPWIPGIFGRWVWHWKDRIDRRFMAQFPSPPTR